MVKLIYMEYNKEKVKMNILVTINNGYVKQLNILLNSIQYSNLNEKFDIYVLYKDSENIKREEVENGLDLERFFLHFIKINKEEVDNLPSYEKRYPVEIYFRIFATQYLPQNIDRILYLDADIVVINELKELYEMDFEGNYFIAATHIKKVLHRFNEIRLNLKEDEPYINTGVLLMNLKELRKIDVKGQVIEFIENNKNKLMLPDQDIISSVYGSKIKLVDELKYNLGDRILNLYNLNNPKDKITLKWICKNTVIIHYYGRNKPEKEKYVGKLGCFYYKVLDKMKANRKKKVLILSCGTGGGHNSAAHAIQENLQDRGIEADFMEYLEIISPKVKDSVNKLYLRSTSNNGGVFKHVYKLGELYEKTKLLSPVYTINSLNKKKLYKYIVENEYVYIVTTHLFAAQALTSIKKEYKIHFMAVATDYVSIPFWEETNPDYFIIPSKELEDNFIEKGISKKKLLPLGIPVSKRYNKEYDIEECKNKLGLDINKRYVLILNGSMGFGNVIDMLRSLLEQIEDINFIVSCGNNVELLEKINELENDRVTVLPFVNNLNEYMSISEIVLTKPGGLTTSEIATLRKPLVHIMPIPGCENYNANFFSERKMSMQCKDIEEVVKNTKKLLEDKELQKQMIVNQAKYINKNACDEICNVIIKEITGRKNEIKI